jgi:hypothetical protein
VRDAGISDDRIVINATELLSPKPGENGARDRAVLAAFITAAAQRFDRVVLLFRQGVVKNEASVAAMVPSARGKLSLLWASETPRLIAAQVDAVGRPKLSASGARAVLGASSLQIHTLSEDDVSDQDVLSRALGLDRLVKVSQALWDALRAAVLAAQSA